MISGRSAIVFDFSVVIKALASRKSIKQKTIRKFHYKNVYENISNQSKGCTRVDIVTDSYPDGINLKGMTQHHRGIEMCMWNGCGIRQQYSIAIQLCQ